MTGSMIRAISVTGISNKGQMAKATRARGHRQASRLRVGNHVRISNRFDLMLRGLLDAPF